MFKVFKDRYPKFQEVLDQCLQLIDQKADFENIPDGQIAIQTNDDTIEDWFAGTGKSVDKTPEWEHSFCYLQPSLKGTAIEDYFKWLEIPVYRARIMLAKEKGCYSIHQDYSPRLHLPLVTNSQCNFLLTDPLQMFHLPADGTTTWVDTRRSHTFMNGSTEKRLHLVMIVKE